MNYEKLLFKLDGRLDRASWVLVALTLGVTYAVVGSLLSLFNGPLSGLVAGVAVVVFAWVLLVISTKRLHDMGRSGWWNLIFLLSLAVPFVGNFVWVLMLIALPGTAGENEYGKHSTNLLKI